MDSVKPFIHLIGDSTLDNVYWLINSPEDIASAQEGCVKGQLTNQLGGEYQVEDHSYDGFTTTNVLNGGVVGEVLRFNQSYLLARTGNISRQFVDPLTRLKESILAAPNATHYVVISVGGNDFRVLLSRPRKLLGEIPHVQRRYLEIVKRIQGIQGVEGEIRPVFMLQYRTDARSSPYGICTILGVLGYVAAAINTLATGVLFFCACQLAKNRACSIAAVGKMFFSATFLYMSHRQLSLRVTKEIFMGKQAGLAVFGASLERLYKPILEKAKEDHIPVLDLPNLFDPTNPALYKCEIEPSREGGRFIAEKLVEIITKYESFKEKTEIFKNWRVRAL